jgi:hypothetical protein
MCVTWAQVLNSSGKPMGLFMFGQMIMTAAVCTIITEMALNTLYLTIHCPSLSLFLSLSLWHFLRD